MTVTLSYDTTLSRVRVDATSLGAALTANVERSIDGITWTVVRGGVDVPVTAGVLTTVDDYEFDPDVSNQYRVTYRDTITYVAAGTSDTDNNASVTPGVPAGTTTGDTMVMFAGIRNFGTATVNVPAGWTTVLSMGNGNVKLLAKTAGSSESTPTVSFAGGAAGADTAAQTITLRGVDLNSLVATGDQLTSSTTNIITPALELGEDWYGGEVLYLAWKADDWSGASLGTGTEIAEMVSTAGNDMAMVWSHRELAESVHFDNLGAQTWTITGSTTASCMGGIAALQAKRLTQTNSITPTLDSVWIKNLSRPFLNRAVTVTDWSDIERPARNAVFDIIGRTVPIAVTDLRSSRRYELVLTTATVDEANELDTCLAAGDPILLHVPADCDVPGMYAVVGDVTISRREPRATRRYLSLPLIECAAPGPDILGATMTWSAVIAAYATWTAEIADNTDWQDLLDGIAPPTEVIVS